MRTATLVILGVALAGLASCGPARRTESPFETLLGGLPPGPRFSFADLDAFRLAGLAPPPGLPVASEKVKQYATDSIRQVVGGDVGPDDVGLGTPRGAYRVGSDRLARRGFLLVGPPPVDAAFDWLADPARSARGDPELVDLIRALGEPAEAEVMKVTTPCGGPIAWSATAARFPTGRLEPLGAWVFAYGGADGARAATADLDRVRRAVAAHPPPGPILQVDLRPRAVVVTFRGRGGDPGTAGCG